ncbi:hypothetical protein Anapl_00618 [Anas platyrhynchos]|uniref:Uncharacterized protein n=1 Tax=Anas platyrhynchos TaxID=8839 RepID=R0LSJ0_ANAPL|nr:hypothetical protein Anapl_00618 [Anas platyrhynchos]
MVQPEAFCSNALEQHVSALAHPSLLSSGYESLMRTRIYQSCQDSKVGTLEAGNKIRYSKCGETFRIQDTLTEIATRRLKKPSQPSMASSHNRPEGTSRATNRTALGIHRETRCVYMQEKPLGFSVIQEKATLGQYICSIPSL